MSLPDASCAPTTTPPPASPPRPRAGRGRLPDRDRPALLDTVGVLSRLAQRSAAGEGLPAPRLDVVVLPGRAPDGVRAAGGGERTAAGGAASAHDAGDPEDTEDTEDTAVVSLRMPAGEADLDAALDLLLRAEAERALAPAGPVLVEPVPTVPRRGAVIVVAWGVTPLDPAVTALVLRLACAGIDVADLVAVRGDRWISATWPTDPLGRGRPLPGRPRRAPGRVRAVGPVPDPEAPPSVTDVSPTSSPGPTEAVAAVEAPATAAGVRPGRGAGRRSASAPPAGPVERAAAVAAWATVLGADRCPLDVDGPPPEAAHRLAREARAGLADLALRDAVLARLAAPLRSTHPAHPELPEPGDVALARRRVDRLAQACPAADLAPVQAARAALTWADGDLRQAARLALSALAADPAHGLARLVFDLAATGTTPRRVAARRAQAGPASPAATGSAGRAAERVPDRAS